MPDRMTTAMRIISFLLIEEALLPGDPADSNLCFVKVTAYIVA
jgi:hypothetical protein